jgi:murein DD-endopeptidase MepM/ murein hydrolase activator NlpD
MKDHLRRITSAGLVLFLLSNHISLPLLKPITEITNTVQAQESENNELENTIENEIEGSENDIPNQEAVDENTESDIEQAVEDEITEPAPIYNPNIIIKLNDDTPVTYSTNITIEIILDLDEEFTPSQMQVDIDSEFPNSTWQTFDDVFQFSLPDETNDYIVFFKFKDQNNLETTIYSKPIRYEKYDVFPDITTNIIAQPLLGGDMEAEVTIKNIGNAIGYGVYLELDLPDGISFATQEDTNDTFYFPNFVSTEKVVWQNITDLLPDEECTVKFRLNLEDSSHFEIGDKIELDLTAKIYEDVLDTECPISQAKLEGTIQAFRIEQLFQKATQLVGSDLFQQTRTIKIQTNNSLPSQTEQEIQEEVIVKTPVIIQEILDAAIEYIPGSERIINLFAGEYTFNIYTSKSLDDSLKDILKLEWIIDQLTLQNYQAPLTIEYDVTIPYKSRDNESDLGADSDFANNGEIVSNNQKINVKTNLSANYKVNNETIEFSTSDISSIQALYLDLHKKASTSSINPQDEFYYEIDIDTSQYYDFGQITISDTLPDGIQYIDTESLPNQYLKDGYPIVNELGQTEIKWIIENLENSNSYSFRYFVKVLDTYIDQSPLYANDSFVNTLALQGEYIDATAPNPTGIVTQNAAHTLNTPRPKFQFSIWDDKTNQWIQSPVYKTIGDKAQLKITIDFPANVDTKSYSFTNFLPPYTTFDESKATITHFGNFEFAPEHYTRIGQGGMHFNFGNVEKGSSWNLEYEVEIDDNPNLSNSVILRNITRTNFENSKQQETEEINKQAIVIAEPKIKVSKKKLSGYLQAGDTVKVEVKIANIGLSEAFSVGLEDSQFSNTNYIDNTLEDNGICEVEFLNDLFLVSDCNITIGEPFTYSYLMKAQDDVLHNTSIDSNTFVDKYYNQEPDTIGIPFREYEETIFEFKWRGEEAGLVTNIEILSKDNISQDKILRGEENFIVFSATNVGKAPIYNFEYHFINQITTDQTLQLLDGPKFFVNSSEQIPDILYPKDKFYIKYHYQATNDLPIGIEFFTKIEAEGENLLSEKTRKAPIGMNEDSDHDDITEKYIQTGLLDSDPPIGTISFKDQNDNLLEYTNDLDQVWVEYEAHDQLSHITMVRFSDDGFNWHTIPSLPTESDCGIDTECNIWNGEKFKIHINDFYSPISYEGRHYKYMQVFDFNLNSTITSSNFVFDQTPPSPADGILKIGLYPFDLDDPSYTGQCENYITYKLTDHRDLMQSVNDISKIQSVKYSTDGLNYSNWIEYIDDEFDTKLLAWPCGENDEELEVWLKSIDFAGNESQDSLFDNIIYFSYIPELSVSINDNQEFTNLQYVALKIGAQTHPNLSADQIRLKYCGSSCESENFGNWMSYFENSIEILKNPNVQGKKQICAQIKDNAGNISDTTCDEIKLDTSAPIGSFIINNGNGTTRSTNVTLDLDMSDPTLCNGQTCIDGSGISAYQTSFDSIEWTNWQNLQDTSISIVLPQLAGTQTVYLKMKDHAGNESNIVSDEIFIDTNKRKNTENYLFGGEIVINNDDIFTDFEVVTLNITTYGNPTHIKIWNENENPENIPMEVYTATKNWTLADKENFGTKKVNVQFFKNSDESDVAYDEIIFAPIYSIEYELESLDAYTNENSQVVLFPYQEIDLNIRLANMGSLFWQNSGDFPVNISYHVLKKCTDLQEHLECLQNDYYPYMLEGLRSPISRDIGYMQAEDENFVTIQAPLELGDYKIQIDAVHESKTWFSAHNNPTPEILIQVVPSEYDEEVDQSNGNILGASDDLDYQGHFGIGARKDYIPPVIMEYTVHGGIEINGLKYAKYVRDLSIGATYVDPQPYSSKLYYTHLEFYKIDEIDHEYNWWCDPKVEHSTYCQRNDKYKNSRIDARLGGLYDNDHRGTSMYWFEWFLEIRGGELGSVEYLYRKGLPETKFSGTYVMLQTVADRDRNKTYADPYFFVIDHSLDYQNPPSQTPVIEFDQSSMTPVVPGTACGQGDVLDNDALLIDITNWKSSYTLQARYSNDHDNLENTEWTNTLTGSFGQSTFNITGTKATFHLPHTENQPDGEMFWQARIIQNGIQVGDIVEYSYQVTNDLNHEACLPHDIQTQGCMASSVSTIPIFTKSGHSSLFSNSFEISHLETFEIVKQLNVEPTLWYEIKNGSQEKGWVPAYYVSKNESCDPPVFISNKPLPTYQKGYVCNVQDYIPIKLEPNWESGNLWKYNFAETRKRDLLAFKNYDLLIVEDLGEWKKVLVGPKRYIGYMHQAYICNASSLRDLSGFGLSMPFEGKYELTYPFAPRPDGFHYGDDFGIHCNTPVKAVYDGKVVQIKTDGIKAGNLSDMDTPANYIVLEHELNTFNTKNEAITKIIRSYYWHLNEVWVEEGVDITQNQTIGLSGNTGFVRGNPEHELDRQGCHLHFEIREIDEYQQENPIDFARNPLLFLADQIDRKILQNLKELFFKAIDDVNIILNTDFGQGSLEIEPGKASVEANVIIKQNGDLDIRSIYYEIPPPIILNVEPNTKQNKVYIGGMALSPEANYQINIKKITGQKSGCLLNCDIYETSTQKFTGKIDYAYVTLFQKNSLFQKDKTFTEIPIESNGRWGGSVALGTSTVQLNDTVYAKTRIIDSESFKFGGITYNLEDNKDFRESRASNEVKILEMSDENMVQIMKYIEKTQKVQYSDIKGMYDVRKDSYAYEHIKELLEDGVLQGYSDGTFKPNENIDRAVFSVYLVRAFDIPFVEGNSKCKNFPDVIAKGPDYNFTKFIHALKCSGITTGYNNETEYRPDELLDRGSASILLMKTMQHKLGVDFAQLKIIPDNPFTDAKNGNYSDSVAFLSNVKIDDEFIIAGFSDGTFRPNVKITREQMAKYANLARKFVENSTVEDSSCGTKGIVQDLGNNQKVYRSKLGTYTLKKEVLLMFDFFRGIRVYGWPKKEFGIDLEKMLNTAFPQAKDGLNKKAEWIDGAKFEKGIIGVEDDFPFPVEVYQRKYHECDQEEATGRMSWDELRETLDQEIVDFVDKKGNWGPSHLPEPPSGLNDNEIEDWNIFWETYLENGFADQETPHFNPIGGYINTFLDYLGTDDVYGCRSGGFHKGYDLRPYYYELSEQDILEGHTQNSLQDICHGRRSSVSDLNGARVNIDHVINQGERLDICNANYYSKINELPNYSPCGSNTDNIVIFATHNGLVTLTNSNYDCSSNAKYISMKSADDSYGTVYLHLDELFVEKNDYVRAGQPIGIMGSTGYSSGRHLHYDICEEECPWKMETKECNNTKYQIYSGRVDPLPYLLND